MKEQYEKEARKKVIETLEQFACSISPDDKRVQSQAKLQAAEILLEQTKENEMSPALSEALEVAKQAFTNLGSNSNVPPMIPRIAEEYPPNPLDGLNIEEEEDPEKK